MHPRFHSTVSTNRAGYFQQHHEHESDGDMDKSKSTEVEQFSNATKNSKSDKMEHGRNKAAALSGCT
jgi:hypothetical protein